MEDSLRLSFQKTDPKTPPRPKPSATLVRAGTGQRGSGGMEISHMDQKAQQKIHRKNTRQKMMAKRNNNNNNSKNTPPSQGTKTIACDATALFDRQENETQSNTNIDKRQAVCDIPRCSGELVPHGLPPRALQQKSKLRGPPAPSPPPALIPR